MKHLNIVIVGLLLVFATAAFVMYQSGAVGHATGPIIYVQAGRIPPSSQQGLPGNLRGSQMQLQTMPDIVPQKYEPGGPVLMKPALISEYYPAIGDTQRMAQAMYTIQQDIEAKERMLNSLEQMQK